MPRKAGDLGCAVQFNAETPWHFAVNLEPDLHVVNLCFTSLFGTKGLLSDIVIR